MDVVTLRKNAEMTIETLKRCRNEKDCGHMWELSVKHSEKVKSLIKDHPNFEFQNLKTPRLRKVLLRLQALIGEEGSEYSTFQEAIDQYRVNVYFISLDLVVSELESRFSENDLDLLCALSEVVMNSTLNTDCLVADQYDIDKELLIVEHNLFHSGITQI